MLLKLPRDGRTSSPSPDTSPPLFATSSGSDLQCPDKASPSLLLPLSTDLYRACLAGLLSGTRRSRRGGVPPVRVALGRAALAGTWAKPSSRSPPRSTAPAEAAGRPPWGSPIPRAAHPGQTQTQSPRPPSSRPRRCQACPA